MESETFRSTHKKTFVVGVSNSPFAGGKGEKVEGKDDKKSQFGKMGKFVGRTTSFFVRNYAVYV